MRNSRFPRSVQLVARKIQPRYAIHDSLVACILMHDRTTHGTLFTLSEYSRFRATSCTLRSTINPHTERNKVRWFFRVFFQTTYYPPSRTLFISNVACILMHDRTTHGTLFILSEYSRFRATSCTLRFPVSCIKMHATIQDFVQQVARYDSGVDTNRGDVSDVARTLWFK